jgi:hypothetical protein
MVMSLCLMHEALQETAAQRMRHVEPYALDVGYVVRHGPLRSDIQISRNKLSTR